MYQAIILDLIDLSQEAIEKKINIFKSKFLPLLKDDGILWVLCNLNKENNKVFPAPFFVSESFKELQIKNIILRPNFKQIKKKRGVFDDHITKIIFFTKNNNYYFNKDPIREKHIWKNVEWGKRKKNYHPKGKDPGNVWLKTKDDGKANITAHIELNDEEMIRRCILCSTKKKDKKLLVNCKTIIKDANLFYEKI